MNLHLIKVVQELAEASRETIVFFSVLLSLMAEWSPDLLFAGLLFLTAEWLPESLFGGHVVVPEREPRHPLMVVVIMVVVIMVMAVMVVIMVMAAVELGPNPMLRNITRVAAAERLRIEVLALTS